MKTILLVWLLAGHPINAEVYKTAEACNKAMAKQSPVTGVELKCVSIAGAVVK